MNTFDTNTKIQTIIIVGCTPPTFRWLIRVFIEEKNVGRQLVGFSETVLGLPKAEVVGRRLNMALWLDIA